MRFSFAFFGDGERYRDVSPIDSRRMVISLQSNAA